ncbi:MAG: ABC transporter ATP-binding protein [Pygmaiobacter sp.]|nr:ABC transporter ATP-binding protein [Pygmaiobacter sp.]
MEPLLQLRGLGLDICTKGGCYPALSEVEFELGRGEIVGLVGESGCGKSLTSLAIAGLLPAAARVSSGQITFDGQTLTELTEQQLCQLRGKEISMVFQEPMTALNPLLPVGVQIAEAVLQHGQKDKAKARQQALDMMQQVGLSRPQELYWEYPHQLSGGMKQRIVIAMALINHPALLIADEPTTALDVTIQHQILLLLQSLNRALSTTVLLVSHDLGVVREICGRVVVMYAGFVVEQGTSAQILYDPQHPYTRRLLESLPSPQKKGQPLYTIPGVVAALDRRKAGCCPFCDRCDEADAHCRTALPPLMAQGSRTVRCFHAQGAQAKGAAV